MKHFFDYKKIKYRFLKKWKRTWMNGIYKKTNNLLINEASTCLNYSQQCFEGIKSFKNKKNLNFRINLNSYRFQKSSRHILSPIIKIFNFIKNIKILNILNKKYFPNIKIGFLYLRPLLIGKGENIGVKTSLEFYYLIFATPFFFKKENIIVKSFLIKRTLNKKGHLKIGSNYVFNIYNNFIIKQYNINDYIHVNNNNFEEIGTSNIILIYNKKILSPLNKNILNGINKISYVFFLKFKKKYFNKNITFNILNNCKTIFCCGTAANFKLINIILHKNKIIKFKLFFFFYFNFFLKKIQNCFYKSRKWLL
ncbi:MAG: aminotransferase class IV [Candidatus Carsonella ruddii]